jgi:serine/threonine-protein kinase HipA
MKITQIQRLKVFLDHYGRTQCVGELALSSRKIYFEYDKAFLEQGLSLSPYKLPLQKGLIACEDPVFEGLFGLFADSLPDGWGKLLIDRQLHKEGHLSRSLSPLDRLAFVGSYGMGALRYEPCDKSVVHTHEDINLDSLSHFSQEILKGEAQEMVQTLLSLNGSSAGARPKAMIQMNDDQTHLLHGAAPLEKGYTHWMVKFASSMDAKESGAIEYAYSLMAKRAGLQMPPTSLLKAEEGNYFACERFDRQKDERIHVHTLAGLIHEDFRFPTLDYDTVLTLTNHLTKNMQELERAFRLACFNVLSHNRDDHAKNISYCMNQLGEWKLSPAYDLTFSSGPGGEQSTTVLGEGKHPSIKHLLSLAHKHHIKEGSQIINEVREAISQWKTFAKLAHLSSKTTNALSKHLKTLEGLS